MTGKLFAAVAVLILGGAPAFAQMAGSNGPAVSPGGMNGAVQYNNSGAFGGSSITGLVKGNGTSAPSVATAGTDYAPATTGSSILKASAGGFANAVAGTDYVGPTTGSAIQKASSGGLTAATAGTDYGAPNTVETWTASQKAGPQTPTLSTTTFTPDMSAGQAITINLTSACTPCTIANPTNMPSSGIIYGDIKVVQPASGGPATVAWGSYFKFSGGTAPTLSTAASAEDDFGIKVDDSTDIFVGTFGLNFH
jgi:hypothetical protein